jgi:hypothetical protein
MLRIAQVPVKTRLPSGAWIMAAMVAGFSLLSSLVHELEPSHSNGAAVARATMTTANDDLVTGSIR